MPVNKMNDGSYLKIYHSRNYDSFFKELRALKRLNKVDTAYFPKLLDFEDRGDRPYLKLSNCGFPVTMATLPLDFSEQIKEISSILDRCGVNQRDPSAGNLLVKDGILRFIDFGHSEIYEQSILVQSTDPYPRSYEFECDYIEEYADTTLYILHTDSILRELPTYTLKIFKTPVYNHNLFILKHLIETLN
jgi:hypothetical protein